MKKIDRCLAKSQRLRLSAKRGCQLNGRTMKSSLPHLKISWKGRIFLAFDVV